MSKCLLMWFDWSSDAGPLYVLDRISGKTYVMHPLNPVFAARLCPVPSMGIRIHEYEIESTLLARRVLSKIGLHCGDLFSCFVRIGEMSYPR